MIKIDVPEGHVAVILDERGYRGFRVVEANTDLVHAIAYQPEQVRVIPASWLAEREAIGDRYAAELKALDERVAAAPRYSVAISLVAE